MRIYLYVFIRIHRYAAISIKISIYPYITHLRECARLSLTCHIVPLCQLIPGPCPARPLITHIFPLILNSSTHQSIESILQSPRPFYLVDSNTLSLHQITTDLKDNQKKTPLSAPFLNLVLLFNSSSFLFSLACKVSIPRC